MEYNNVFLLCFNNNQNENVLSIASYYTLIDTDLFLMASSYLSDSLQALLLVITCKGGEGQKIGCHLRSVLKDLPTSEGEYSYYVTGSSLFDHDMSVGTEKDMIKTDGVCLLFPHF